jgi:hypothetical protein
MMRRREKAAAVSVWAMGFVLAGTGLGEEHLVRLNEPDGAKFWHFDDNTRAKIANNELVMDGRKAMSRAFFVPMLSEDFTLRAKFMVEPGEGVLACGFMVRVQDSANYYYVHYDRGQAILCRSDRAKSWNEIQRKSGLDKPAGVWHDGAISCVGDEIKVYLNGELLYTAKDSTLKKGRIGFYANQGVAHVKDIVLEGKDEAATEPFRSFPPEFVRVCSDAGAGAYEAFPDVCRLGDGRLMSVFYAGYGHVALPTAALPKGGRVVYCLSSDEGRTWTEAKTLYDGPDDDRDPSIVQLASGRMICNFFSLRKADGESPPWTGLGTWTVVSDDNGKTWSAPKLVAKDYYCSSPIRQLSDDRLILGLYAERDGKGWGTVVISQDEGESWGEVIDIDNGGMRLDAETDVIELRDGSLFAAERGRDETMAWSKSTDGGKSWSVSKAFGFPGHCPYLHRTVDDILLMAHRLPATSLHYSLDEGATWSENVAVDEVGGAYPSMVNLKDGTVLIVYYEEGSGSDIRAKRFRATRKGIQWMPVESGPVPEATLVSVRKIWDAAPHNAFTNLIRHKGEWFCVFREGQGHVSPDGALRVITSKDGETWTSAARITSETADLRDAQITVAPDGRLMLSGAAALHQPAAAKHQTMAYFSEDGRTWSDGVEIGEPNFWLWRVTWHQGTAYGLGYSTTEEKSVRLYKSTDGKAFDTLVSNLFDKEYPNESSIVFLEDDSAVCLLRRQGNGLVGRAKPPYTDWTWKDLGVPIGGPDLFRLPDGRFVAAVRLYDGGARTSLCWLEPETGSFEEFLRFPSGGDTSYAGMVWHEGLLWVSYYSSHEGKTSIYLAKVSFN